MAILVDDLGIPQPPSDVTRRLREVHPGAGLLHTPHAGPQWAITLAWAADDPRWALVQSQAVNPNRTFDIIGYLPYDCAVDHAPSYLARVFRTSSRPEVQRMAEAVESHNTRVPLQDAVDAAIAEVLDQGNPSSAPKRRGRPSKPS